MEGGEPRRAAIVERLLHGGGQGVLRVLTCGSVDDGKSTLIGRLLYDTRLLLDDQLLALEQDSRRYGTAGDELDFALLLDGLVAEREQGITIDVAYRYFATAKRKFIVADAPGHEQYTRNMATAASTADVALILVDARNGVRTQTRRHSYIAHLLGIRHLIVAVNKMDLVLFSAPRFEEIVADCRAFVQPLAFASVTAIPVAARWGENVARRSERTPWYRGPTLLDLLETIEVAADLRGHPFRMPVQWVNRPHLDFRGFSGTVASGVVRVGDAVLAAESGRVSRVHRIVTADADLPEAGPGEAITLVLADEIDIARGDVLADPQRRPTVGTQFSAHLLWMGEEPMLPGRGYLLKLGTRTVPASITALKHTVDVDTMERRPGRTLGLNEIGRCTLDVAQALAFDPYRENRDMGGFIVIDRFTFRTVGAGMIEFGLRRSDNVHWQALSVGKAERSALKGQKAAVVWFTGLSGSGKSTVADQVERRLAAAGRHTFLLDGDNVRHGLNRDLGFTTADRVENIRRVGEVAKLFVNAGMIVLCAFISPFRAERRMVRELLEPGEFVEVHLATPLAVCRQRDAKGLYRKAIEGKLPNFTGIDSPYEPPENADIVLDASTDTPEVLADRVIVCMQSRGIIGA